MHVRLWFWSGSLHIFKLKRIIFLQTCYAQVRQQVSVRALIQLLNLNLID